MWSNDRTGACQLLKLDLIGLNPIARFDLQFAPIIA
jgi:hypothetical protein